MFTRNFTAISVRVSFSPRFSTLLNPQGASHHIFLCPFVKTKKRHKGDKKIPTMNQVKSLALLCSRLQN